MSRILALLCFGVLIGCSEDGLRPCAGCPESYLTMELPCDPCAVGAPIEVSIQNDSVDQTLVTSICDWKVIGLLPDASPFAWEDAHRLDCSAIDPSPLSIGPGETGVLEVGIDPSVLPELQLYEFLRLVVTLRDPADGENAPVELGVGLELAGP